MPNKTTASKAMYRNPDSAMPTKMSGNSTTESTIFVMLHAPRIAKNSSFTKTAIISTKNNNNSIKAFPFLEYYSTPHALNQGSNHKCPMPRIDQPHVMLCCKIFTA